MKPRTGHEAFKPLEFESPISIRHLEAHRKFKEEQIALVEHALDTRKQLTLITYKARKHLGYYEEMDYDERSYLFENRTMPALNRLSNLRLAAKHLAMAIKYMRKARGRL